MGYINEKKAGDLEGFRVCWAWSLHIDIGT